MERKGGGGRGPSVICPYVTIMIQYDTISWGDFSGELCAAQCPNLIRPDRNYVVSNRCEEEPQSHFFFSFFFLIMQHIPASAEEQRWTELEWPIHQRTPSYHPTRGCTVERAVQLGKHAHVSSLPNEHTPQWAWAAALLGTGLHVTNKPELTVPWYREDAADLQHYQCVFPLPALSHITQGTC